MKISTFLEIYNATVKDTAGLPLVEFTLRQMLELKKETDVYELLLKASQEQNIDSNDVGFWFCDKANETFVFPNSQVEKNPTENGFITTDYRGQSLYLLGYKHQQVFFIDVTQELPAEFYEDEDIDGELNFFKIADYLTALYKQNKPLPSCAEIGNASQVYHGINYGELHPEGTYIVPFLD